MGTQNSSSSVKPIYINNSLVKGEELETHSNLNLKKKCAVLDFDGTLRSGYTVSTWLKCIQMNFGLEYDFLSDFNELLEAYKDKKIEYEDLVVYAGEIYADACLGLKHSELEALADQFVNADKSNIYPYTEKLLDAFKKSETTVFVVSGAPELPLKAYFKHLGINQVYGLRLSITNTGKCNGNIKINFGTANNKHFIVSKLKKKFEIRVAIGDAESDWPILKYAEYKFNVGGNPISLLDGQFVLPSRHKDVISEIKFNIL